MVIIGMGKWWLQDFLLWKKNFHSRKIYFPQQEKKFPQQEKYFHGRKSGKGNVRVYFNSIWVIWLP